MEPQLRRQADEPLDLIYPKEGIITADYPFMLLNAAKRDAYQKGRRLPAHRPTSRKGSWTRPTAGRSCRAFR